MSKINMELASASVVSNVAAYLEGNFGNKYSLYSVYNKSNHPADNYLYMVIAKANKEDPLKAKYGCGPWACWTCWNEKTQSLNFGHYDLDSYETALNICKEYFCD